jgi:hypothetical protein
VLVALLLAWTPGCGGESVRHDSDADQPNAGTTSVGGQSSGVVPANGGAGASAAGGATGAAGCTSGAPCSPEGSSCQGTGCCPPIYECRDGAWFPTPAPCIMPGCPANVPDAGSACGVCALECRFECGASGAQVTASCEQGSWVNETAACAPVCCATDADCSSDSLCVGTVCKLKPASFNACYRDSDCPAGRSCLGVHVCACGGGCHSVDMLGYCEGLR